MAHISTHELFSGLSFSTLVRAWRTPDAELQEAEAASTLFRFFRSKHVRDLKLIAATTVVLLIVFAILVVISGIVDAATTKGGDDKTYTHPWVEFFKFVATYLGSAIGVAGFVVGWAYQTASARLGVVDLFACEITTLCRVGSIMDIASRYTDLSIGELKEKQNAPATGLSASEKFVSEEDYFPILQTNAEDLQRLEALVVRHITEFYTYMKATRDTLRRLQQAANHEALIDVLFMLFLGYESARKAVSDLIEFQPTRAENTIVILLTELRCYSFLIKQFPADDVRHIRLELRKADYQRAVPDLCGRLLQISDDDPDWRQAQGIFPELASRYKEAVGEDIGEALRRREIEAGARVPGSVPDIRSGSPKG
jgi:hypothetical protein